MDATRTKLAFVIIKLRINRKNYLLLRRDKRWEDVSFVGGHAETNDKGDSALTALRELQEELPFFRQWKGFELKALERNVSYGPVYSKSAGRTREYDIDFYLLRFKERPIELLESLYDDSETLLLEIGRLCSPNASKLSAIVNVISPGCKKLQSIERSWDEDLSAVSTGWTRLLETDRR